MRLVTCQRGERLSLSVHRQVAEEEPDSELLGEMSGLLDDSVSSQVCLRVPESFQLTRCCPLCEFRELACLSPDLFSHTWSVDVHLCRPASDG